ncbi:hypothetical protein EVAR_66779_1 [Eumeta japonica]|uniref:Uncharacterized protein n=1 Tax=Eumeta variegata TaxID=151549 RepID=A0A4C1ZXH9_EUMVA|nr:hypothetical protein EVAR_66779_1 [Eumeta japonica]
MRCALNNYSTSSLPLITVVVPLAKDNTSIIFMAGIPLPIGTNSLCTDATASRGAKMAKDTTYRAPSSSSAPFLDGIQGCLSDWVIAKNRSTDMAVIVNTLDATATPGG